MRNKYFIIIILLIPPYIYADEIFSLNFNIATIGFGVNYSSNVDDSVELFAELLTIGVEHKYSSIELGFSPLKYWSSWYWEEQNDTEIEKISFLNLNISWNILDKRNLFLGPFSSINYIFLENGKMQWNEFILTGGIRFIWSFSIFQDTILSHFISSEIGYRNINRKNKFHFNISIDLITLLYFIPYFVYDNVNNNNYGYRKGQLAHNQD